MEIHALFVGQPQTHTDKRGSWRSAIFRAPVDQPITLSLRGLDGDQVADTEHHGSPDQAVCCHPLEHYAYWNELYRPSHPDVQLGPGSVGENWTISGANEHTVCIGDIFQVGSARVQVSGPRYPCTKQERKVQLPSFHRRTIETLRTGWYLRVLTPGTVQPGDALTLEQRPYPDLTVQAVNACGHHTLDSTLAQRALAIPELMEVWKYVLNLKLHPKQQPA